MKKFVMCFFKSFFLSSLLLIAVSCQKKKEILVSSEQTNYIVGVHNATKTNQEFLMVTDIGHDGTKCPGCVLRFGEWIHIDCQGYGNACRVSANMTLYVGGSDLYAVTTDTFGLTDQSYFNMPARSLSTEDEKGQPVYLNIPAQLVYRDSSTLQFTFTGLYYTTNAAYDND